jgi:antitoxin (DNA-binding transcriptional repressor) of toxin-antitoxin stability system
MLYEVDIEEAAARFAEMMQTIAAGYGVLIKQGDDVLARLVPESAFHEQKDDPGAALTPEERDAKETFELFQSDIEDSF